MKPYYGTLSLLNRPLSITQYLTSYNDILTSVSDIKGDMDLEIHRDKNYYRTIEWFEELENNLKTSHDNINIFLGRIDRLKKEINMIFKGMDFGHLYDEDRELFSIGYDVENNMLSESHYDLLASEARQASFIAIAKGDVPKRHWFKLGRLLTSVEDKRVLLSWSGTMFEYLMPLLIMKNYSYTLLDETYKGAVKAQRRYAESRRVPWGISESAYNAFDRHMNYQYKAFGVPALGLKRGLVDDLVITPYATILALQVDPLNAIRNIHALMDEGLDGDYGLFEAIDYTSSRVPREAMEWL